MLGLGLRKPPHESPAACQSAPKTADSLTALRTKEIHDSLEQLHRKRIAGSSAAVEAAHAKSCAEGNTQGPQPTEIVTFARKCIAESTRAGTSRRGFIRTDVSRQNLQIRAMQRSIRTPDRSFNFCLAFLKTPL
ncbi:MAG: hypothetical protein IPO40_19845 [Fibrobacteres bacterium]|nr:hypothetical protein [Fibrobacterota bacterium]